MSTQSQAGRRSDLAATLPLVRGPLLWMVPAIITVHNLEELAGMPAALLAMPGKIPAGIPVGILQFPPSPVQFMLALLIVTVLPYIFASLTLAGERPGTRRLGILLLAGTQAVMLVNVFSHLGMARLLGGYAPGIVTALALNLPFSVLFFGSALRQGWLARHDLPWLALAALLVHSIGLLALMWMVGYLA